MKNSKIEWTENTWNPTTGCTKISQGCKNCYAETMTKRLIAMGSEKYMYMESFNDIKAHINSLDDPFKWKKPSMIFVNSMSDLFHSRIPIGFIFKVFLTMNKCTEHTFQVLTKRHQNLFNWNSRINWTKNIWMGVSVENKESIIRMNYLKKTNAYIKFLSIEPLLEDLGQLDLSGIDWVIVGGESGNNARPIKKEWVTNIKDQCEQQNVPFFFKQWGGVNKKRNGRLFEGKEWNGMPDLNKKEDIERQLSLFGSLK